MRDQLECTNALCKHETRDTMHAIDNIKLIQGEKTVRYANAVETHLRLCTSCCLDYRQDFGFRGRFPATSA